jgi:hypothetical protein
VVPSEIPAVGVALLVCDGITKRSVSMAGEADVVHRLSDDMPEWISKHRADSVPHDTYEQQMMKCEVSL